MIQEFLASRSVEVFWGMLRYVYLFYPIWLPLLLGTIFWDVWVRYVRLLFFSQQEYVVLDIRLPRELTKSPSAMEVVISALYNPTGDATFYNRYWEGKTRPWSSLELVSIGGEVHFYICVRKDMKDTIETQIYSQYPDVEVHEAEDYSLPLTYNPDVMSLWGTEMVLTKADPYPIKTYIDYGLDKDPKEEFKIDPLTPVLEYLGSLRSEEQAWIQIVVRAHKKEKRGGLFSKPTDWTEAAKKEVKEIIKNATNKPADQKEGNILNLSKGDNDKIAAIERSIDKPAFDAGIRMIYWAPKDKFSKINLGGLAGSFRQFNSNTLNGFKLDNATSFKYPWQDYKDMRLNGMKQEMLAAYKRRGFFYRPYLRKTFILTTEELATLFHFPGSVAATPNLPRIPSKKAQPPANLPV